MTGSMSNIQYRPAGSKDACSLMRLYRMNSDTCSYRDPVFSDPQSLEAALGSKTAMCFVADKDGEAAAACLVLTDPDNRLCKLHWMGFDPSLNDSTAVLSGTLLFMMDRLKHDRAVDIIYSTTRNIAPPQQELTVQAGFKTLGIFPTVSGADSTRINRLTAWFFDDVLTGARYAKFSLHPVVKPFFEIAGRQCLLPPLPAAPDGSFSSFKAEKLPPLELIRAPRFVEYMFGQLMEKNILAAKFYPFQKPDALISDPARNIGVFLKIIPQLRFAAVIGEQLDLPVDPVELYRRVGRMLHDDHVEYIEIINDAADAAGIDCILKAGFLPCGYFPAFRKQGGYRRDYVILARTSRKFVYPPELKLNPADTDYLREYSKLQGQTFT